MKQKLFGTSGIRGDAETLFTDQFSFDLGRAFALFLRKYSSNVMVALGMDPRGSSPRIKKALISGLISEGCEIYDQGATSVPSMNYILIAKESLTGSLMISGSHIKPHLNGVKFFSNKSEILKNDEEEIENIYIALKERKKYSPDFTDNIFVENDAQELYMDYLISKMDLPYPNWKVVVDPGDGAQSDTMPVLLKRMGLDVVEMNSTIQGEFFSRDTEVSNDFLNLQEKVRSVNADFGIGYDSDGDRVIFINEKGEYIPGDYTGTLIAQNIKSEGIVTPINTSQVIEKIDKKVIRTKVGSPYVVEMLKKYAYEFGFEANGGCIFKDMFSRDGGRTTVEILNILKLNKCSLSELVSKLPRYFINRSKIDYQWDQREKIERKVKDVYKQYDISEVDGIKIWVDSNSWILFRSSQNAPEFRVFAESQSQSKSKNLLDEGLSLVKEAISEQS